MNVKFMRICDFCGNKYQFGPHVYDGKYIKRYDMNVCLTCYNGNKDGWADISKIIKHLKEKGLPIPETNAKGWLPLE